VGADNSTLGKGSDGKFGEKPGEVTSANGFERATTSDAPAAPRKPCYVRTLDRKEITQKKAQVSE